MDDPQNFKTAYDFLLELFDFITDLNQSILTRNAKHRFKLFCAYAIPVNANKFITPVPVYKMKYLLKCQY